jgi:hypothetical protein
VSQLHRVSRKKNSGSGTRVSFQMKKRRILSSDDGGVVEVEMEIVSLEEDVEEEVLEGGEVVLVPKGGVAEVDMVDVIRETGLNLSDDMRKKRKTCESLIREFEGRGSTFQTPRDMLDLGLWACLSQPVTLKWSSFSLSCCGMLLEILGERCGQSKEEMKAQCRPHLRELSRAVRNILPDSKYTQSAQPLMKWDLERFQLFFSGTPPTSKNGQVLAMMELGHLTGRRVRTLLDLIWEHHAHFCAKWRPRREGNVPYAKSGTQICPGT